MDNPEKSIYWFELADYDLDSAKVMQNGGKYLYVAFMCHQNVYQNRFGAKFEASAVL